jgi:hypothetical protein
VKVCKSTFEMATQTLAGRHPHQEVSLMENAWPFT